MTVFRTRTTDPHGAAKSDEALFPLAPCRAARALSAEQSLAVTRAGQDVCVVAGPGSGKTRVLVERFGWLVEQDVSPLRVLAITFTEKAASEIKQRLVRRFENDARLREQIERAWISTIHGLCARLLRENALAAGIDPEFRVLDEREAQIELSASVDAALDRAAIENAGGFRKLVDGLNTFDLPGGLIDAYHGMRAANDGGRAPRLIVPGRWEDAFLGFCAWLEDIFGQRPAGWSPPQMDAFEELREWSRRILELPRTPIGAEHFRVLAGFIVNLNRLKRNNPVYDAIRELKSNGIQSVRRALLGEFYAGERERLGEIIGALDRIYRERKQSAAVLDFSDLEEAALRLLRETPAVRERVRSQFDAILMDELQDTNPLQWALMELLRTRERFFAVGDINQSIYGFRYAEPELFRKYRAGIETEGGTIDRLRENHRSREPILRAVEMIVRGAEGIEPPELVAKREFSPKPQPAVEAIVAFGDEREQAMDLEARLVAQRIGELAGRLMVRGGDAQRQAKYSDIAVLLRTMEPMARFEEAFRDAGIPYAVTRGRSFFESQEITDLLHLLRVIANPRDEISLAAVLRSPLAGISDEALFAMKRAGGNLANGLSLDTGLAEDDAVRLSRFRGRLERLRARRDYVSPDRLIIEALETSGYRNLFDRRAEANIEKFLALLRDWHTKQPRSPAALTRELEVFRRLECEPEAPAGDASDAVQMMTIHAAKGLEFPVVFMPALHRGVNQSPPPAVFAPGAGIGGRWRDPATGEAHSDPICRAYRDELQRKEAEEANRLLYVAMTRAEEQLVLSWTNTKRAQSPWPERIEKALSFRLEADNQVVEHRPPGAGFSVRLWRCDGPPKPEVGREEPVETPSPEVEMVERPDLGGQHDSAITVTSVALFASCPRRYYLERYLGWGGEHVHPGQDDEPRDADALDAAELGRQAHAILAGERSYTFHADAIELAARFTGSDLGRRAARAARAEREFDFLMAHEDVVLRGQIDLWFEESGELVLVDYKTDRDAGETPAPYALQLRLYALALEKIVARMPDRASLFYLRTGREAVVTLEPREIEAARKEIAALRLAQERMEFPLREGEQCGRCPFWRGLCPAGGA